jgi:uncharacterized tellurite resistance protein B-like protein
VLLTAGRLAESMGIERRPKLSLAQSQGIASTGQQIGFLIEPDSRLNSRPYEWDSSVAIWQADDPPRLPGGTPDYARAALILEIGMAVAAADGELEDQEVSHLMAFLEGHFSLGPTESKRVDVLRQVFASHPPSLSRLGKRLEATLTGEQRESVGRLLIGIAGARGGISRSEANALRAAYRVLGLSEESLVQVFASLRAPTDTVDVRPQGATKPGEVLPPRSDLSEPIAIDKDRVRELLADSDAVAALLTAAMAPDDVIDFPSVTEASISAPVPESAPEPPTQLDGLDLRYQHVVA